MSLSKYREEMTKAYNELHAYVEALEKQVEELQSTPSVAVPYDPRVHKPRFAPKFGIAELEEVLHNYKLDVINNNMSLDDFYIQEANRYGITRGSIRTAVWEYRQSFKQNQQGDTDE